jgi:hypothetical protein
VLLVTGHETSASVLAGSSTMRRCRAGGDWLREEFDAHRRTRDRTIAVAIGGTAALDAFVREAGACTRR